VSRPDERRDVLRELNRAVEHFNRVNRPTSGASREERIEAKQRLERARRAAREMRMRGPARYYPDGRPRL
jgi:hypothetical protein